MGVPLPEPTDRVRTDWGAWSEIVSMHSRRQSHMAIMATAAEADAPTSRVSPAGSRPPPPPASHRPVPLPSAATAWHLRPMDRWASPPPPLLAQSDDEMEEPSDDLPHLIADGSPTRERVSPEFTELWRWGNASAQRVRRRVGPAPPAPPPPPPATKLEAELEELAGQVAALAGRHRTQLDAAHPRVLTGLQDLANQMHSLAEALHSGPQPAA